MNARDTTSLYIVEPPGNQTNKLACWWRGSCFQVGVKGSNQESAKKEFILLSSVVQLVKSCIFNIKFVLIIPFRFFNHTSSLSLILARLSLVQYFQLLFLLSLIFVVKYYLLNINHVNIIYYCFLSHILSLSLFYARLFVTQYF